MLSNALTSPTPAKRGPPDGQKNVTYRLCPTQAARPGAILWSCRADRAATPQVFPGTACLPVIDENGGASVRCRRLILVLVRPCTSLMRRPGQEPVIVATRT